MNRTRQEQGETPWLHHLFDHNKNRRQSWDGMKKHKNKPNEKDPKQANITPQHYKSNRSIYQDSPEGVQKSHLQHVSSLQI